MFLLGSTSTNVFAIDDTNNVETSNVADNNTDSSKSVEEATEESDKEPDTSDIPKQTKELLTMVLLEPHLGI